MKTDRKTTITAIVTIVTFVLARYGIALPIDVQLAIGLVGAMVFAYFTGDKNPRPPKRPFISNHQEFGNALVTVVNRDKSTANALHKRMGCVGLAFVLIFSLILTGCTKEQVQKVHNASTQIVDKLKVNANIPQLLLDEKLITQEVYEQLTLHFRDAISIASQFRDDLGATLQTQNPGTLTNLVPTLANLIAMVNLLKIQGHEKLAKLSKFLTKLESFLRVIRVFFTQEVKAAKSNPLLLPIVNSLNESDVQTITEFAGE